LDLSLNIDDKLGGHPAVIAAADDLKLACNQAEEGSKASLAVDIGKPGLHPEGFRLCQMGARRWMISGNSPLGCSRGLSFVSDRIRAEGSIPTQEIEREPAFERTFELLGVGSLDIGDPPYYDPSRYDEAIERAGKDLKVALLHGANHVILQSTHRIASWPQPPASDRTEIYRELYSEVAREAHSYGMKCLVIGDEFLYQPEMLERGRARLSPEDGAFWNLLQTRYRQILDGVPQLDGIAARIGEVIPIGNIRAFDVVHNDSNLSIEEKYRRFVGAMYQVVVNEYDRLYYHRTWVVNDWEQHSVASIFRSIFDSIPRRNLIVSIKLTKTDQWWYQGFNPTFGQTDHETCVELEMSHGPHGDMKYPDYMGEWFQAGLNYALGRGCNGVFFGPPSRIWMDACHYAARRLIWDPSLQPRRLAADWASMVFGAEASEPIAEMLLESNDAVEKSLYILPYASTHAWNPIEHLMTCMFVVKGNPIVDGGRGHADFLREIYLLCKPKMGMAMSELRNGLAIHRRMVEIFQQARPKISNQELGQRCERGLSEEGLFLELNVAYVLAFLRFFRYEETPTEGNREEAAEAISRLRRAAHRYREEVGWFSTIGIDTFLEIADRGITDLEDYGAFLKRQPTEEQVEDMIEQSRLMDEELIKNNDLEKLLRFEADVDGIEVLTIEKDQLQTEHIASEQSRILGYEISRPFPEEARIVLRPIEARGTVYVAQQPSAENGGVTKIAIEDPQDGRSVYIFEAYRPRGATNTDSGED